MTIFNPYNWYSEKEIKEAYNVLASLYCSKSYLQAYQLASNLLDIIEKHLDSTGYRGELKDDVLCSLVNGHKQGLGKLYQLAGEITSILNKPEEALIYYQKFQYWNGQTQKDASLGNRDTIIVYSYRAFNTYSMLDLINSQITCGRPSCMNDPFDSIFNSWSKEHI